MGRSLNQAQQTGTRINVRTARATTAVTFPPGSRTGLRLRLLGQGLADGERRFGDCFVRIEMNLPEALPVSQAQEHRVLSAQA